METRRLRCGIEFPYEGIDAVLNATQEEVVWQEKRLPPAPGVEGLEEAVGWPEVIAGVVMPPERIAFYRRVRDTSSGSEGYGVESLAAAVRPGRDSFMLGDFKHLECDGTLTNARTVVLSEVQRFLAENL